MSLIKLLNIIFLLSLTNLAMAEPVRVGGYDKPPYMMKDSGLCVDVIREALKRAGFETDYQLFPHKRMHVEFVENRIDVEPCAAPEWRRQYQDISFYSDHYFRTENVVVVRKNFPASIKSVQDFSGKRLGSILGYFITDGFQEAFEAGEIIREDVSTQNQNIKRLYDNRIDGFIVDKLTGLYLIETLGYDLADFEIAYVFKTKSVLSARFHRNVKNLIPEFDQSLREMKEDGTIERIIVNYAKNKDKS